VELRRGTRSGLASLEPLWVTVHHRHVEAMPELAPHVDDQQTWEARSALYSDLLTKPGTVLLLASSDEGLIGYGLAHVVSAGETWVADTWRTGERIGEIESLAVLPSRRDRGIGTMLLDELESALEAIGVTDFDSGRCARQHRRHPPLRAPRLPTNLGLSLTFRRALVVVHHQRGQSSPAMRYEKSGNRRPWSRWHDSDLVSPHCFAEGAAPS
jgi:ribosomal protein S18 acetylase RimI-like enzyme